MLAAVRNALRSQQYRHACPELGSIASRSFCASVCYSAKALPPRPKINEDEIEETFLKGTGPGGQAINKTNSAVQLKHIPTGIVVKSQATRSRMQNRKYARNILAEKLDELEKGSESRTALKAEAAKKKKASASKKSRRKYRKLKDANQVFEVAPLDKQKPAEEIVPPQQKNNLDHVQPAA